MGRRVPGWFLLALALSAPARAEVRGEEFVPGRVIVRYRIGAARPFVTRLHRVERAIAPDTELLRAADDSDAAALALVARLSADPAVLWAEREHIRRRSGMVVANDPYFKSQWALTLARIPWAWSRTEGSEGVTVAILDSGIRPHPDLEPRYLPGYDFVSNQDFAGDDNGRDDDPTDPGTPDEASSALHGMHIAGIIGAHTDNHLGIAGVDWRCKILPVRVLGVDRGKGTDSDIADGIRWAAGIPVAGVPRNPNPARVINLSFGGRGTKAPLLQTAIDQAHQVGAIIVAAAGNDGEDTADYAPAALNHVIAVAASDDRGQLAWYSNRGDRVDLMAPGGDLNPGPTHGVLSTMWTVKDGYTYVPLHGTSQSTPHVAGVAALMKALDPTLNGDRAKAILVGTADPGRRCEAGCGGGLLDADAALAAVQLGCADGHCARVNGFDVTGGCAIGGRAPRGGGFFWGIAVLGWAWARHRRGCGARGRSRPGTGVLLLSSPFRLG